MSQTGRILPSLSLSWALAPFSQALHACFIHENGVAEALLCMGDLNSASYGGLYRFPLQLIWWPIPFRDFKKYQKRESLLILLYFFFSSRKDLKLDQAWWRFSFNHNESPRKQIAECKLAEEISSLSLTPRKNFDFFQTKNKFFDDYYVVSKSLVCPWKFSFYKTSQKPKNPKIQEPNLDKRLLLCQTHFDYKQFSEESLCIVCAGTCPG